MTDEMLSPAGEPGLSPAERKALRARAHALDPVVMIGSAAVSPGVIAEIDRALAHHELIKVRVLAADRDEREQIYAEVCAACHAQPVQHLGRMLILYRERPPEAVAAPATPPTGARRAASGAATHARVPRTGTPARGPVRAQPATRSGRR